MFSESISKDARILILGAGPSGLSAAWFLQKHGFKRVTVFERLGRVGGMCRTVLEHQHAVELGASFVSPSFHQIIGIARELNVELLNFAGATAFTFDEDTQTAQFRSLLPYVMGSSSWSAYFRFARLCQRYLKERRRFRRLFQKPGWAGFASCSELNVSFAEWLHNCNLSDLRRFFELPITAFGYGSLEEIPAAYCVKYMSLHNLVALFCSMMPFAKYLPDCMSVRCFKHGYQRFWERVAWDIDVRLGVHVRQLSRLQSKIEVTYTTPREHMESAESVTEHFAEFDYLIIACPGIHMELSRFVDFDDEEKQLEMNARFFPNAAVCVDVAGLTLPRPMVVHAPPSSLGRPLVLWQPNPDSTTFTVLVRLRDSEPTPEVEREVRDQIVRYVTALGGQVVDKDSWRSFDVWPYFKHVALEQFRNGYFDRWEERQGKRRTFYTGGLYDFDHVEGAVQYSRFLVERYFAGIP